MIGMLGELRVNGPGMMTLITVATATAYIYNSAVSFGLKVNDFFWSWLL
jgi:Cu2+-exporting ATPase